MMKPAKSGAVLLLCLAIAFFSVGCGSILRKNAEAPPSSAGTSAANASQAEALREGEKYNAYVRLNNLMVNEMHDALVKYFSAVADQGEFSLKPGAAYAVDPIPAEAFEILEEARRLAERAPDYPDADSAVRELYLPMKTILTAFQEAAPYANDQAFLNDGYQKAGELHADLYPKVSLYNAASSQFFSAVAAISDEMISRDLALYQNGDLQISYHALRVLYLCDKMQRSMEAQAQAPELGALRPQYEEIQSELDALRAACTDPAVLAREGLSPINADLTAFLDSIEALSGSLGTLMEYEQQREGASVPPFESALNALNDTLAAAIDAYNQLRLPGASSPQGASS